MPSISGTMTNDGRNLIRDCLKGSSTTIKYIALGTSSTTPTANDHTLGVEVFRKAITSYTNGTNPGEVIVSIYVGPGETVGVNIEEIGIFGGNAASSATNSGVMIARALFHHPAKTNTESIIAQLDFKLA